MCVRDGKENMPTNKLESQDKGEDLETETYRTWNRVLKNM